MFSSMSAGTSLNMYSTGKFISPDSLSISELRMNPYQCFFDPHGIASIKSIAPPSSHSAAMSMSSEM